MAEMEVADSLLDLVGNTPRVRLDRIGKDLQCPLAAKPAFLNAGGSADDRPRIHRHARAAACLRRCNPA